ncbi:MAG: hypothetical protein NTW56_11000 [Alphaproteobacteria bacterium]|jgi:hypothetical protein|nr:hypothetical protein [Alphaproteobacteria bacterium]
MTTIAAAAHTTRRHTEARNSTSYVLGCAMFLVAVVGLFGLAGF